MVEPAGSLPPTERHADRATPIDALDVLGMVQAMHAADLEAAVAVGARAERIAAVVEAAAQALLHGGRLIYCGAGTSGRLGVLDASECPPTFGVSEDTVVGLIAGGEQALRHSIEGAEDDEALGAADMARLTPSAHDLVVGIAASGTTPYVLAALKEARRHGAATALVCCNPDAPLVADTMIALDTGPEVLAGSTRLKAGTATKMVLNMISTAAMARAGLVFEGCMVGMRPANAKLKRRAARIIAALCESGESEGAGLLAKAGNDIRVAVLMGRLGLDAERAKAALEEAGGVLRDALEAEPRGRTRTNTDEHGPAR